MELFLVNERDFLLEKGIEKEILDKYPIQKVNVY